MSLIFLCPLGRIAICSFRKICDLIQWKLINMLPNPWSVSSLTFNIKHENTFRDEGQSSNP